MSQLSREELKLRPVKDLKEFLLEYGIRQVFTEKEEMIDCIKRVVLNEEVFQQRQKQRCAQSQPKTKSDNNPLFGAFNSIFGPKGESNNRQKPKTDFFATMGAFAQELQQVLMLIRK